MSDKPIEEMSGAELRLSAALLLRQLLTVRQTQDDLRRRFDAVQARLLNPTDDARLREGEGIPTKYGVLTRHEERKGRAWVVTDEVDKDAGELGELAPKKDKRVVIEHLSEIPTGIAAELLALARPGEPDEDTAPVSVKEKAKYPTVAKLREAFGADTKYVGKPPIVARVVLRQGEGDDAMLITADDVG